MRRRLYEEKIDIDLSIIKALGRAPLTITELYELEALNTRDLMSDHDLDYILAERVTMWVKHEKLRLQAQNQQTPLRDFKSDFTSLTRSNPITQRPPNLSEKKLRKLIRQMVNEESSG